MILTTQQKHALESGQAIRVTVEDIPSVLLREDVYDRVRRVIEYDDGPLTDVEQLAALRHVGQLAGWDDPEGCLQSLSISHANR